MPKPYERPRPCARCGVLKYGRTDVALCGDCRYVLSSEEKEAWQIDLSHGKKVAS